jgi:hypothetical protein
MTRQGEQRHEKLRLLFCFFHLIIDGRYFNSKEVGILNKLSFESSLSATYGPMQQKHMILAHEEALSLSEKSSGYLPLAPLEFPSSVKMLFRAVALNFRSKD